MVLLRWINSILSVKSYRGLCCLFVLVVLFQVSAQADSQTKAFTKDNIECEVLGEARIKMASARAAIVVNRRQDMINRPLQLEVYDTSIKLDKIWVYSAQNKYDSVLFHNKIEEGNVSRPFQSEKKAIEKVIVFYKNIGKQPGKIVLSTCH